MAIAITLRGFNDLGRQVTPIFLSTGTSWLITSMINKMNQGSIEKQLQLSGQSEA